MRGKWEKERKKNPRWVILLLVLLVIVLFLALFFARDLLWKNRELQYDNAEVSADMPADSSIIIPDETEIEKTDPTASPATSPEPATPVPEIIDEPLEIVNAYISSEDHLILVYSNGKEMDTGPVDTPTDDTQGKFKVVFLDYNDVVLKEEYVSSGESATPPTAPIKDGYVFVGWDGSYEDISADINLKALYAPSSADTVTYTVRFADYDGVVLKTETVLEGNAATAPGTPLREGYEFTGWDKAFDKVTSNLIIMAQYQAYAGPEMVIEAVEATAGSEDVAVTIRVKNNPGIASMKLLVTFGDDLTLTKVEYDSNLGGHTMQPQTMGSPVTLNWVSPFEDKTGDLVFATLYFTVADSAKGTLPISATYDPNDVFDLTETNIKFRVSNGAIIVP